MKTLRYSLIILATLFATYCNAQIAVDDFFSVPVGTSRFVNLLINDTPSPYNSLMLSSVWGSPYTSQVQQYSMGITYNNTTLSFTGKDTCYYSVYRIDAPAVADTGMIIFDVISDSTVLPVADFEIVKTACNEVYLYNKSTNHASSAIWYIKNTPHYLPILTLIGDTSIFSNTMYQFTVNEVTYISAWVTLFVSNEHGNAWISKRLDATCVGINEIGLSNISLYPNPTSGYITIDMSNNDDEITRNYAAIEVYNVLGEKQKAFVRSGNSKTANLNVSELPQGMYVTTLLGANGERRVLGKFTKE